ncbi:hypothetical protein ACRAWF_18195, partial [Streptomyces sp. L7]
MDGGRRAGQATCPVTANWNTWGLAGGAIQLGAGHHTIALTRTAADSGDVNIDSVALVDEGDGYPPTSTTAITGCG